MARATYEGLLRERPSERPFLLTRACFAGSQRYAAAWTGDNVSSWEHLLLSLQICQSLSASGLAFCGPDIGGFAGRPSPELYARWMQAGVLYPFMRTHYSHEEIDQQEPWSFGEEVEAISKRYMELRYRLLPTLYTAFADCTTTAEPPMKALFLEHPEDPRTHRGCDDQMYLGPTLMAAPVVTEGVTSRDVYFPDVPGGWFDLWTGAHFEGGESQAVPAPLDTMPMFGRSGGVVALDPPMLHTEEFVPETLTLMAFPGMGTNSFYFDDGLSYAYRDGDFHRLSIDLSQSASGLDVAVSRDGVRTLPYLRFEWQVPLDSEAPLPSVSADGRLLPMVESAEAFEAAEEVCFRDGTWLRIRTRTDIAALSVG
jgi:alpha-glucosidase